MRFSQRHGYTSVKDAIQMEGMDDELRSGLWDAVQFYFWDNAGVDDYSQALSSNISHELQWLWHKFFKQPVDTIPYTLRETIRWVRKYFFECEWYEVYDFIEELNQVVASKPEFRKFCNVVLERENSGYRFVNDILAPISSATELESIDDAISIGTQFGGASAHLRTALTHLANRKNPDYRNSAKESISAVESLCRVITGKPKAKLGDALSNLEKAGILHAALRASFNSLYGYTSDEGGIRHAMLEEPNLTFTDAKYLLVACSAFVNYMIGKIADGDYKIPPQQ
jgi:AbiJ N-terminal domain 4